MTDVRQGIADRVPYRDAGSAHRQAVERAVAQGESLARTDWRVLAAVLCETVSFSKLADRVAQQQVVRRSGVDSRQLRRALGRLAEHGIILWVPGRGAGKLTVVGVPPSGLKADEYLSSLGLPELSSFHRAERGQAEPEKADTPRARAKNREDEKKSEEQERNEEGLGPPRHKLGPQTSRKPALHAPLSEDQLHWLGTASLDEIELISHEAVDGANLTPPRSAVAGSSVPKTPRARGAE